MPCRHQYDEPFPSPTTSRRKIQSAICFSRCFRCAKGGEGDGPAPPRSSEVKERCRALISRIGRPPRRYEGEFRYDPMSYARNFDEGGEDGSADEERFRFRDFASRLPSTPPMPAVSRSNNQRMDGFVRV
ncbi:hypothetical protein HPP92_023807 [Vanilla planifolia]|uniref:Uncharacterized protein n=1 Tax=Vanilla planifolia TaxID=51239 RepID=A0A835PLB1_VANPL|nr:hypothetical protein HPP92_023807 [Vanilla planifolia]